MNKERRNALDAAISKLGGIKFKIEALKGEEQEYFDNMPEGLQQGEKGSAAEEAISNMEDAINNMEEAISSIDSAKGG